MKELNKSHFGSSKTPRQNSDVGNHGHDHGLGKYLDVYVDSDWAGCQKTRRSTSGGVITLCGVELWHWSVTQKTVALSSAEAENGAALEGLIRSLYVRNLLKQQGVELKIRIFSDSSAAIGHSRRQGNGKRMRHLEFHDMYIQQVLKDGAAEICKINGTDNPADLFTKHLSRELIIKNMSRLGFRLLDDKNNEVGCKDLSQEINQDEDDEEEDQEEFDQWIQHLNQVYYVPSLCSLLQTRATSVEDKVLTSSNPESPVEVNVGTVMSLSLIHI